MSNQASEAHFFDYATMMERLHSLADTYSFLTLSYIGTSILDRAIPILHIGNGSRRVLYVGAHHGMEWLTAVLLLRYCNELCEGYAKSRSLLAILPTLSFLELSKPTFSLANCQRARYLK